MIDTDKFQPKALQSEISACINAMTPEEQEHAFIMLDRIRLILNDSDSPVDFTRRINDMLRALHDSHATLPEHEWYGESPRPPPLAKPVQDGAELYLYIGRDPCFLFYLRGGVWETKKMLTVDYISTLNHVEYPRFADIERDDAPGLIWRELINCWDSVFLGT